MKASDIAKAAGIGKETLRYYEKMGMITPPPRQENSYRSYSAVVLEELKFIKLAKSVGFTLNEVNYSQLKQGASKRQAVTASRFGI